MDASAVSVATLPKLRGLRLSMSCTTKQKGKPSIQTGSRMGLRGYPKHTCSNEDSLRKLHVMMSCDDTRFNHWRFPTLVTFKRESIKRNRPATNSSPCRHIIDTKSFLSRWFLGAPFESIGRENVEDFVSYGFYDLHMRELSPTLQEAVRGGPLNRSGFRSFEVSCEVSSLKAGPNYSELNI